MKATYRKTEDYHVEFEDVKTPDGPILAVHCSVSRWTPSIKKQLKELTEETYDMLQGQPFFAFSDNDKLSKFIASMGAKKIGTADTDGVGYAEVFMFNRGEI
jgi:hypothetical protein